MLRFRNTPLQSFILWSLLISLITVGLFTSNTSAFWDWSELMCQTYDEYFDVNRDWSVDDDDIQVLMDRIRNDNQTRLCYSILPDGTPVATPNCDLDCSWRNDALDLWLLMRYMNPSDLDQYNYALNTANSCWNICSATQVPWLDIWF